MLSERNVGKGVPGAASFLISSHSFISQCCGLYLTFGMGSGHWAGMALCWLARLGWMAIGTPLAGARYQSGPKQNPECGLVLQGREREAMTTHRQHDTSATEAQGGRKSCSHKPGRTIMELSGPPSVFLSEDRALCPLGQEWGGQALPFPTAIYKEVSLWLRVSGRETRPWSASRECH